MFKHQEIIDKLTLEQKLNLIADVSALGGAEGYAFLKEANFDAPQEHNFYPSFSNLANSWDTDIVKTVSQSVFAKAKASGVNLVTLPTASVKVSPYSKGLSEDGYFAGEMVSQIAKQGKVAGIATCLSDPQLDKEDVSYLDNKQNARVVYECLFSSQLAVLQNGVSTIELEEKDVGDEYGILNKKFVTSIKEKYNVIIDKKGKAEKENHVEEYGKLYKGCSIENLKDAYQRYLSLKTAFENGEIALSDVNSSCDSGSAISDEMIDTAVDKILDYTDSCTNLNGKVEEIKGYKNVLNAIAESTVLLKNNQVLPLRKNANVLVVGTLASQVELEGAYSLAKYYAENLPKRSLNYVGFVDGYKDIKDRNLNLMQEALNVASNADVVVVTVGYSQEESNLEREKHNCKLPANQEEIIRRLNALGKKVIALVYGGVDFDMSFDKYCDAVLIMPVNNVFASRVSFEILMGEVSPGGRLKNTLYSNTDTYFKNLKDYKNANRNKVGVFYGYRHYDTGDIRVKYPFGFGLSYGNFNYSNLSIKNGEISFLVKNKAKITASEVVQIYVGKSDSQIVRPKKELKYFEKITLEGGQTKKITLKTRNIKLSVYSEEEKCFVTENGKYQVYIGSNVRDIKLQGNFELYIGKNLKSDGQKHSDYIQSKGNIYDGGYSLEEIVEVSKEVFNNKKLRLSTIVLAIVFTLVLAYMYFDFINYVPGGVIPYMLASLVLMAPLIVTIVLKVRDNKKIKNCLEKSKSMKKLKRDNLQENQINQQIPYEELFETEFETPIMEIKEDAVVTEQKEEKETKIYEFNPEITIKNSCNDLVRFVKEQGIHVDYNSVKAVFSARASSRLIVFNSEDKQLLIKFIELLGKYFACDTFVESFQNIHGTGDNFIYSNDVTTNGFTTIANTIIYKPNVENQIRLMAVTDMQVEYVKPCLTHLLKYLDQPDKETTISARQDEKVVEYTIPENVWFIFVMQEEQKVIDIPKYILESICEVNLVLREIENENILDDKTLEMPKVAEANETEDDFESELQSILDGPEKETAPQEVEAVSDQEIDNILNDEPNASEEQQENATKEDIELLEKPTLQEEKETNVVTYYQFEKMVELALKNSLLEETLWKRLDKLETSVNAMDKNYRLTNKVWQRLEKYVAVYLTAEGEQEDALDSVVANFVINTMINSVVNGTNKTGEKFITVIENIFGEDHISQISKKVKSTGLKI